MKMRWWTLGVVGGALLLNSCGGGGNAARLATHFSVTAQGNAVVGTAFKITVTALDAANNTAATYTGTVRFSSTDGQAVLPAASSLANGTGTFSVTLMSPGPQTVTATDTVTASITGTSNSITVNDVATHFSVIAPTNATIGIAFNFTATALDASNKTVTSYSGTVHFTSSDAQASLPANATLTNGTGTFSVTLKTLGNQTITATDSMTASITGSSSSINVSAVQELTISSSAPPSGTADAPYGSDTTQWEKCTISVIPEPHEVCTPCTPGTGGTCGSFPLCNVGRTFPCLRTVQVFGPFTFKATGGVPPNSWSATGMPPGLSVNASSGQITGTPTSPGTYNVTVAVTDSESPAAQATAKYAITINNPPPPTVNTTPPPPPGVENVPYSFTFTATGTPPFTWSETGPLPTGLAFDNASASLSGTPTQTGSFTITITATDQFNQASTATNNFTIVVTAHGFVTTGSMGTARRFHTATLLNNGKVLVAGGEDAASNAFASAELYDPSTGTFTPTTGSMTVPRVGHTATLLNNGKVLITGGTSDPSETAVSSAELYDPVTDTFTATAGTMTAARVVHTATLLSDGTVLVAGGDVIFFNGIQNTGIMSLSSAEIFNPSTGTFAATAGNMTVARESHTATLLSSGKVLIAGGSDGTVGNNSPAATIYASAELYDPTTGNFTSTAGMMSTSRDLQTANLLSTGKVLIAGGISSTGGTQATADLFDLTSGSFTATGVMTTPRYYQDASTLTDGTVLVTGGSDDTTRAKASAEVYGPTGGTFAATGSMIQARVWHTSTVLQNGKVLVTGGAGNDSVPVATAELYQ